MTIHRAILEKPSSGGISGVAWGDITGTLSSQTDLQTALDAKAVAGAVGSSGLTMSTARLLGRTTAGTGAIEEITVGAGLSLSAGALTCSITQYTDEMAQDAVGGMVNATLSYDDGTPALGINLSNANTWLADQSVPDEAYGAGWNGSVEVPTKNALYDKIESVIAAAQPLDATLTSLAAISGVQGDIIYASGTDAWTRLAKDTNATRYLSNTGTSNNPAWAQVNLANGVTGTLPAANITKANLAGTSNQITLSASGTGVLVGSTNITLSLPQNYDTAATPQLARLGLGVAADATAVLYGIKTSLATTSTDGIILSNTTAATSGVTVQYSPRVRLRGNAWKSNATAASQTQDWAYEVQPIAGAAATRSMLVFKSSTNGAAYVDFATMVSADSSNIGSFTYVGIMSAFVGQSTTNHAFNMLTTQNDARFANYQQAAGSGSVNAQYRGASGTTTDASFNTIGTYTMTTGELAMITARILGIDPLAPDHCAYTIIGHFKNPAGTVAQIGATAVVFSAEETAATDVQFAVSGSNVLIQCKGQNLISYNWSIEYIINWTVGVL